MEFISIDRKSIEAEVKWSVRHIAGKEYVASAMS